MTEVTIIGERDDDQYVELECDNCSVTEQIELGGGFYTSVIAGAGWMSVGVRVCDTYQDRHYVQNPDSVGNLFSPSLHFCPNCASNMNGDKLRSALIEGLESEP